MVAKQKAEKAALMKADKLAKDVEKARKAQNQAKFEAVSSWYTSDHSIEICGLIESLTGDQGKEGEEREGEG